MKYLAFVLVLPFIIVIAGCDSGISSPEYTPSEHERAAPQRLCGGGIDTNCESEPTSDPTDPSGSGSTDTTPSTPAEFAFSSNSVKVQFDGTYWSNSEKHFYISVYVKTETNINADEIQVNGTVTGSSIFNCEYIGYTDTKKYNSNKVESTMSLDCVRPPSDNTLDVNINVNHIASKNNINIEENKFIQYTIN